MLKDGIKNKWQLREREKPYSIEGHDEILSSTYIY